MYCCLLCGGEWGPMPAWINQSNECMIWRRRHENMHMASWSHTRPVHTSHKAQVDPVSGHVNCHFVYLIRGHLLFS